MPIRTSSGPEIDALVADLSAVSAVKREGAIARLTVIGTRAVGKLIELVASNAAATPRMAALRTLEGIAHLRALDAVLASIDDRDQRVAAAAVSAATAYLGTARGANVLDRLAETALDTRRADDVRTAAIDALEGLKSATLEPLWRALADDSTPAVRDRAQAAAGRSTPGGNSSLTIAAACERGLPDDPGALRHAIVDAGSSIALPLLHRLIERIRELEASEGGPRRAEWMKTRAAAHLALAQRGSRLAVYDLRESLEGATSPLPVEFLAALSEIGDESCIEAIAAAYARSAKAGALTNDWWRQHLAAAFQAIVRRERLTKRHAVMKRAAKRWGAAVQDLVG